MRRFLNLFSVIIIVLLCSSNFFAQTLEQLLDEGDDYVEQLNTQKAFEKFSEANRLYPNNYQVLWRLSKSYVDIAEHMPGNSDGKDEAKLKEFQVGWDLADKAVKVAPDKSVCYLRRAIANGRIALYKGAFTAVSLVKSVKSDLEKSIKLGNGGNFVQALSHYVLGRTHLKVCEKPYLVRLPLGLGWGDIDVAEAEIKKAISLYPDFRMFYFDLSKVYIEQDKENEAKSALNKLLQTPKKELDDDKLAADAKQMLKDLK